MEMHVKKTASVAFLPPDKIEPALDDLAASGNETRDKLLQPLYKYLNRYFMKIVKPEGFSVFGLSKRTNNCCEAFHSQLLQRLGERPVMVTFLGKLFFGNQRNYIYKPFNA